MCPPDGCFATVVRLNKKGKDTRTMKKDSLARINNPAENEEDPLAEILRQGARSLMAQALEAEIELFLSQYKDLRDKSGCRRMSAMDICRKGRFKQVSERFV